MKKRTLALAMIPAMTLCGISAKEYRVTSPDGQLSAIVETGGKLTNEVPVSYTHKTLQTKRT